MSSEIPSHNESAQMISEILKRANQLIQNGELGRAQGELLLANRLAKERYKKNSPQSPINDKFVIPQTDLTSLPLAPIEALMATISSSRQAVNNLSLATAPTLKAPFEKPQMTQPEQSNDRSIEFVYYREALVKAWLDGALTQEEERQLHELRTVLEISDIEHEMLEQEIKYSCYKDAISQYSSDGPIALSNTKLLTKLQETYHISQEEHSQVQNQFFRIPLQRKQRDKILIIDDDTQLLSVLTTSLTEDGFDVTAVTTSDEACTIIQQNPPDLILCDINLKTSTMNGFTFFEKVQGNKNLQKVPFIFLTGLTDEELACTGKELGADDFLMKPISRHTLLSTLHGRLKRFKQLRGFFEAQTPAFC